MQTKKRRKYIILGSILLVLIIARLVLPYFVLKYANKSLAEMDGYYGHVEDIDIALYRGAYQLNHIYINKIDSVSGKQAEFFSSEKVDLAIEWRPLFHGSLVGNMEFYSPKLVFTKEKTEIQDVAKDTGEFKQIKKDLMPLRINRFEVNDGSIHYTDSTRTPLVDIFLERAHILATNLRNTTDNKDKLPSTVEATADAYEGSLSLTMKLDALARQPTFDMTAEIKGANLVLMNDFFKAYGKFDVSKGLFGLYTEFAAQKGKFVGYVKPVIKDLKVRGPEDKNDKLLQKAKESVIGLAGNILTNPKKDQVATKVPIEGTFKNPAVNNWEAVWEILRNAFIEALMPAVDNEINIKSVEAIESVETLDEHKKKGFFHRVFKSHKREVEKATEAGKDDNLGKYKTNKKKKG